MIFNFQKYFSMEKNDMVIDVCHTYILKKIETNDSKSLIGMTNTNHRQAEIGEYMGQTSGSSSFQ
jgi:hypothetical protein